MFILGVIRNHVSLALAIERGFLFHVDAKIGSFDDGRPRGTARTAMTITATTVMITTAAVTTAATTATATTAATTSATATATATTTATTTAMTMATTATKTTWMTLSATPTVVQPPLWTRHRAARDRRLVLLRAHIHQHHLLLGDLTVLDVDRLRGIVQARRFKDNKRRAEHAGQREDPKKDPVEHHRDVLPVLLHLGTIRRKCVSRLVSHFLT